MEKTLADRRSGGIYDVMSRAQDQDNELGLRDRHKIDKLERISSAAHRLFARDGYEATTLRAIAREAGVALGTLSLYAQDKRDLILLIFNKLIPPLLDQGMRNIKPSASLAAKNVAFFEPFYVAYAKNVTLYRIVLGQIYGGPTSIHAVENELIRAKLIDNLSLLLARAVASSECDGSIDINIQSRSFYLLYFAHVRAWLSQEKPDPKAGIAELLTLFEHHVAGVKSGTSGERSGR